MRRTTAVTLVLVGVFLAQDVGRDAFALLRTGYGASAPALGGAGTAWSEDVSTLWWNPSGLEGLKQGEIMLGYRSFIAGIHDEFIGFTWPWKRSTLGIAAFYSLTAVQGWDNNNEPTGKIYPHSAVLDIGWAYSLTRRFSVGLGAKLLYDNLVERTGLGAVFDMGVLWRPLSWMSWGVALHDLGPGITYGWEKIATPWAADVGMSLEVMPQLTLSLDGGYVSDEGFAGKAGVEYRPMEFLSIRAGGRFNRSVLEWGALAAPSAGLALYWKGFRIEYALVPYGVLGATHSVCVSRYLKEKPRTVDVLVKVVNSHDMTPLDADLELSGAIADTLKIHGELRRNWVPPGELTAHGQALHHYPAEKALILEPDKLNTLVLALDSIPCGVVKGIVREEGTKTPTAAVLYFRGEIIDSLRTDDAWGNFLSRPLPPGEYLVKVEPDDPRLFPLLERVTVTPGDTITWDPFVSRERRTNVLMTIHINFETGKSELLEGFKPILDSIAPVLKNNSDRGLKIEIAGHTDNVPVIHSPYGNNQALSEARAEAIRSYLVNDCELPGEIFTCKGYGESQPIASNTNTEGRAMNRRIEFRLITSEK